MRTFTRKWLREVWGRNQQRKACALCGATSSWSECLKMLRRKLFPKSCQYRLWSVVARRRSNQACARLCVAILGFHVLFLFWCQINIYLQKENVHIISIFLLIAHVPVGMYLVDTVHMHCHSKSTIDGETHTSAEIRYVCPFIMD